MARRIRRLAAILIAALAVGRPAAAATFTDVAPGSYAAEAIADLAARGILQGVGSGMYMPDRPMTRAQVATLFAKAEKWPLDGIGPQFSDVSPSDWFYNDVEAAASHEVMGGGGQFNPNAVETRAQAISSAERLLGLAHVAADEGPSTLASQLGLALGDSSAPLTRADAAVLVERMLSVTPGDLRAAGDRVAAYVHLLPAGGDVNAGEVVHMQAYAHDSTGFIVPADISWSATGGSIAADGTLTAGSSGTVTVTASVAGGPSASVRFTIHTATALRLAPLSTVISAGSTVQVPVDVVGASGKADPADNGRTITVRTGALSWSATDTRGHALVPVQLPPGTRTLTVTAAGFAPVTVQVTATPSIYTVVLSAPTATPTVGRSEPLAVSVVDGSGRVVPGTFAVRLTADGATLSGAPKTISGLQSAGTLTVDRPGRVTVTASVGGGAVASGTLDLQAVPAGALAVAGAARITAGGTAALTFSGRVPDGTTLTVTPTDPDGNHPPGYTATFSGGSATIQPKLTIAGKWTLDAVAAGLATTVRVQVNPGPATQVVVHPLPTSILLPGQESRIYIAEGDAYGNPVDVPVHADLTLTGAGSLAAAGSPRPPTVRAPADPPVALPGPGVAATYVAPAAPGQAELTVTVAGLPPATATVRTVASEAAILAGPGMWMTFPDWRANSDAAILGAAQAAGITHIYLEVATSSDGFYGGRALDDLLWKAHDAGIAVIAWVYPALWQPVSDIAVTRAVAAYAAPLGDTADGIAADVEENMDPPVVAMYATAARQALGGRLLVGVTYPPQQMPDYPFAALAPYVDAWAPMDYWHVGMRDYTYHEVYTWVAASLAGIDTRAGRSDIPFDVIAQTFDAFADSGTGVFSPAPDEVAAAVAASEASGAEGVSFYRWSTATPQEWRVAAANAGP